MNKLIVLLKKNKLLATVIFVGFYGLENIWKKINQA